MYQILICDDEHWIRKWIEKMVIELRSDCEIVASVENGKQALEIIKEKKIDIIISDIQMPGVNGLEMVEAVKENNNLIEVIFVSGFERFDYVKKAIQMQSVGYLLKPIEKTELKTVLDNAIKNIALKSDVKLNVFDYEKVQYNLQKFFLFNSKDSLHEVQCYFNDIKESDCVYYLGVIQNKMEKQLKQLNIGEVINKIKTKHENTQIFLFQKNAVTYYFIALFLKGSITPNQIEFISFLEKTEELANFNIYLASKKNSLYEFETSVKEVNSIYFNPRNDEKNILDANQQQQQLLAIKTNIITAIRANSAKEIKDIFLFLNKMHIKNTNNQLLLDFLKDVLTNVLIELKETSNETKNIYLDNGYNFIINMSCYNDMGKIFEWVENYLLKVSALLKENSCYSMEEIITTVQNRMITQYKEDINITAICNEFHINSSYFSKKFKEISGMNFIDMLTNIRINTAMDLLLHSNKTLKNIAEDVGFKDPKYFGKVFLAYTGYTPSQFRQKEQDC